ncbi:MAG: hypothetical protein L3J71_05850 [Victivallaceae bacterium]|nr:hypothetical protein [Victivallaceae bacterium]
MLKISTFRTEITPEPGVLLAGYGPRVTSDGVHDPLFISGISFDDGNSRAILLSYDLIGLDKDFITDIRHACAAATGLSPEQIILTCTHTHSGPHTRRLANLNFDDKLLNEFNCYRQLLIEKSVTVVKQAFSNQIAVDLYHYSLACHENINRRVIMPDNSCQYLPTNKHLTPLANNITDPELGIVYFVNRSTRQPAATLINYAAHPLTCQSEGASAHKISSDYPAVLREEVERELGGFCLFTSGACGDLHPKDFESGFSRTREMGRALSRKVINSFSTAVWNQIAYKQENCKLTATVAHVTVKFRETGCVEGRLPQYANKSTVEAELQFLTIGDIAFVGVPGELLCEPGLEIKWHSPFRKTFILYNSTDYLSYITPDNFYLQGGYEAETSHLEPEAAFDIVSTTIHTLRKFKKYR